MSAEDAIPLFPRDYIPRILATVLLHAGTLKKEHQLEREDAITDRLFKRLRKDKFLRDSPFFLIREHTLFDEDISEGGQRGRVDINLIAPPGDETYFAIEAKRLHVAFPSGWQSLIHEYVAGKQGMMCFVTGKYSPFQQAAAMLGYVFDGDVAKAQSGIDDSVQRNARTLQLLPPLRL